MSTRWQIAAKLSDGRFGCIYVHHDGYPEHALKTLTARYTNQSKIDELIALGDCSAVYGEIENCVPYKNDPNPTYGDDLPTVIRAHQHGDEEYLYIWDGQQWQIGDF